MNKQTMAPRSSVRFAGERKHGFFASVLCGMISWGMFALAFLLILTMIAYKNADPASLILPFSYTALCLSALVGGFGAGKTRGKQGALSGAVTGLLLCGVLLAASLIMRGDMSDTPLLNAVFYLLLTGIATLGGAIGGKERKKKRKKRR